MNIDRSDEVGTLARAFEMMRGQLRQSVAEIEANNRKLEARVAERTKEVQERNRQLAAANAIASTVSSTLKTEEILARALERVLEVTGLEYGCFRLNPDSDHPLRSPTESGASPIFEWMCEAECLCGKAANQGVPLVVREFRELHEANACCEMGLRSGVIVPLLAQDSVLGVLVLGTKEERSLEQRDISMLGAIGRQIGMALANASLYEEVQERERARDRLIELIITAQEGERQRIARDLHDSTGQSLSAIIMALETMEDAPSSEAGWAQRASSTKKLAEHAIAELRRLVVDLRPAALDDLGLVPAIRDCAERHLVEHDVRVSVEAPRMRTRLPERLETCLFRVYQEAISNASKHACARSVRIGLTLVDHRVVAEIVDDGIGFDPGSTTALAQGRGLGLLGMRERVEMLGGTVRVESASGDGTRVRVELPLRPTEARS